ncbi:two-component system response regulator BasR [Edwardsiella hoshinae]|uniref:Transcriptional regulatory protein BasR n=1 Tax=Edwardsiella hoshinae TaxID=93378 RepID=A0A376DN35_9GAMM|nr:two-component system response regulator PmrA [Edwardsiella hoshinae]AOV98079.1 two-component system response regulator BasR [Edwardsiella hoshinae]QPR29038.1 two-component system response regulator PmrA [Edwardsiella hoshinae]STC91546.1 Transcriptional regulatory protein BasR [Edwardsiella hoshinae]
MKILIVEDDTLIQQGLAQAMSRENYACDCAGSAAAANALLQSGQYSLIILDLGLPDMDGGSALRQWRREGITTPVLILTARDTISERVAGLDAGADDYLVKPFALAELLARTRALIRRMQGLCDNILQVDNIRLDLSSHQVSCNGQPLEVTPKEFTILARLMTRAGQTISREVLQQDLYSWQDELSSNSLEVHIHNLRRKLGRDRIKTLRGVGYRLEKAP